MIWAAVAVAAVWFALSMFAVFVFGLLHAAGKPTPLPSVYDERRRLRREAWDQVQGLNNEAADDWWAA